MRQFGLDPDDPAPNISGKKLRKRILKARREGVTTIVLAVYFIDTYNNNERLTVSMAHDLDSAEGFFDIVHRYYRFLPEDKKIPASRANVRELFWPSINSRMFVTTAGKKNALSGMTVHNLHKSERAKWEGTARQVRTLDASLNIAARWGNIVEETTANGLNFFYADWKKSESGKGGYDNIFLPWYQDERNVSDVPHGFVRTKEEQENVDAYGVNDAQLQWYREQEEEFEELVAQEYPYTSTQAFVATGNCRWGGKGRKYLLERVLPRLNTADYAPDRVETRDNSSWHGTVTTYVEPEKKGRYMITVDTAKGLTEGGEADYSVAHVWDLYSYEQVCHYRGQMSEHDFAEDLNILGRMYNTALLVVETPGPGEVVLGFLIHTIKYPQVYHYEDQLDVDGKPMVVPGYPMNTLTKPESEGYLASIISDGAKGQATFVWRHPNTIEELIHYVKLRGAVCGAESGGHDDEVTCARLFSSLVQKYGLRGRVPRPQTKPKRQAGYGHSTRLIKGR